VHDGDPHPDLHGLSVHRRQLRRGGALTAGLAAVLTAVVGCGGGPVVQGPPGPASIGGETPLPAVATAAAPASAPGSGEASPVARVTFPRRAATDAALVVRRWPSAAAAVAVRLPARTSLGSPRVLLALEARRGWLRVVLPTRPNGSTGWVPAAAVRLLPVSMTVDVDLAARRLRLRDGGTIVADTPVGIGSRAYPTPRGRFYVTDRVRPADPRGPYGTFALGLSAYSPTLTEFGGGDGQVAIHGTNDPASIGAAVSHGCVRVPDDVAALLARVPLGTPVTVR
jgi:lipoprotein-anchoring transpeptidase ErfK/SrfK